MLLVLLAEQKSDAAHYDEELSRVVLQKTRSAAQGLGIDYIDQLMPRLVEERYGPALVKGSEQRGIYEFADRIMKMEDGKLTGFEKSSLREGNLDAQ